jgi:hypothetical protein
MAKEKKKVSKIKVEQPDHLSVAHEGEKGKTRVKFSRASRELSQKFAEEIIKSASDKEDDES